MSKKNAITQAMEMFLAKPELLDKNKYQGKDLAAKYDFSPTALCEGRKLAEAEIAKREAEPKTIRLDAIKITESIQSRVIRLNEARVNEYLERLQAGEVPPPIMVFTEDGLTFWLADGFHRYESSRLAKKDTILAFIKPGDKGEAALHAFGSNHNHGLSATLEDKRLNAKSMLEDSEGRGWSKLSDREIGRQCHLDHKTVGRLRSELAGEFPSEPTENRHDGNPANPCRSRAETPDHQAVKSGPKLESGITEPATTEPATTEPAIVNGVAKELLKGLLWISDRWGACSAEAQEQLIASCKDLIERSKR